MKISSFVIIILVLGGVFFGFTQMGDELNQQYPNSSLNTSQWSGKYNYVEDINSTFTPVENSLKTIQDENAGWFSKLTAGITAIPYAILIVPQAVFGSLVFGGKISVGFLTELGLPTFLIGLVLVIMLIWAIFKLIEYFNKETI